MPTIIGQVDSYNVPENSRDLSLAFYQIAFPETPLFNRLPMSGSAVATKREWWDDARIPLSTTLTGAYTAGGLILAVAATAGIRVGSILRIASAVYQVASISSLNVTVTLVTGATDANAASGAVVEFLGTGKKEGQQFENSDYTKKSLNYNVTQIFDDYIEFTGTELAVKRQVLNGDLISQEAVKKLNRIYLGMARTVASGFRVAPTDNTAPRLMGGIDFFLDNYAYKPAAAAFSADNLDAFVLKSQLDYGVNPTELWMNPTDLANFSSLRASQIIVDRGDTGRGEVVTHYTTKYGHSIKLSTDPHIVPKRLRLFDLEAQCTLMPLAGRQLQLTPMSVTGDSAKYQIIGEYTMEFRTPQTAAVMTLT